MGQVTLATHTVDSYHASSDDNVSGSVNKCRHFSSVAGPLSVSVQNTHQPTIDGISSWLVSFSQ